MLGASYAPITQYPAKSNYLTHFGNPEHLISFAAGYHLLTKQKTMTTEQADESGETAPMITRPLTPEEIERNQKLYDALLERVFDIDQENG